MTEGSLEGLLSDAADRRGEAAALMCGGTAISYRELNGLASGLCRRLLDDGVEPGDRVVIVAGNTVGFVAAFFGVIMSGAVATCLSPDATARELASMAAAAKPRAAILTAVSGRDYSREIGTAGLHLEHISDDGVPAWPSSDDHSAIVSRDAGDPAVIAFTSGSTGVPKGAVHRAKTIRDVSALYVGDVLNGNRSTLLSTLPLYHLGGLVLILIPALMCGGTVVLIPRFSSSDVLAATESHGIDVLMAIPTMMELILRREQSRFDRLKSVHTIVLGGAPVSNALVREIHARLGVTVRVGYGTTEIPGFWCITRPDTPASEVGQLVGWPAHGCTVSIRNGQLALPEGELGEICVSSAFSMIEYVGDHEATAAVIDRDGWLHTGDLGMIRKDGGLVILGRAKDMYIRGGFNVYPREIEDTIGKHPDVASSAVHAVPDDVLGERGYAWIVPRTGATLEPEELRGFLQEFLSWYKIPDTIRVVDELPVNEVGKVDKKSLIAAAMSPLDKMRHGAAR